MKTKRSVCRADCKDENAIFSSTEGYTRQICNKCRRLGKKMILPKWENKLNYVNKNLITYGEAFTMQKEKLHMKKGNFKTIVRPYHNPRMNRKDAGEYYTKKINKVMGWDSVPRTEYFPEHSKGIKDFDIKFPIALKRTIRETRKMLKMEVIKNNKILMECVA